MVLPFLCCVVRTLCYCRVCIVCVLLCSLQCILLLLGMFVLCSFCMSLCRCTVSNALLMSRAVTTVRCGGLFALNPVVIVLLMWCSAVVVDLFCLKPCWCSGSVMLFVI